MRLHINIDHVATVRQARRTDEPDPVRAAVLAELGGADGITVHLREDRRHIQERDVRLLLQTARTGVNLELAVVQSVVDLAVELRPMAATIVPERREEITTEGGLSLADGESRSRIQAALDRLAGAGIKTSLFVDPDAGTIAAAADLGADAVELHTGAYAGAWRPGRVPTPELERLRHGAELGLSLGLHVHAGHGLTYENVAPVAAIAGIEEVNIGHSVVSRAVLVGMERAVREMKETLRQARRGATA
ncbi:MAG TPA: pyridoxine 5'-phosphate synthase [Longimicrobiales bacterium]|nr:pyridoxine 5'-phosphate synthase [Longimicrobiales bacterium]